MFFIQLCITIYAFIVKVIILRLLFFDFHVLVAYDNIQ